MQVSVLGNVKKDEATKRAPDPTALRRGDLDAIEAALTTLLPFVRRWLLRLLGPGDLLDDATQDALVEISQSLTKFKGKSSLSTFAHRITVRCAYRYFSKPSPIDPGNRIDDIAVEHNDPESLTSHRQLLQNIYRCMETLPGKQRVAFVLCTIEGMTPSEAAKISGTLPVTMRSRLKRARAEIQRQLRQDPSILKSIKQWRAK